MENGSSEIKLYRNSIFDYCFNFSYKIFFIFLNHYKKDFIKMDVNFSISNKKLGSDFLNIDIGGKRKRINCGLSVFKYRDKDTRQIVLYIPSLEITSYGATEEKAEVMMKFSMHDYFEFLCSLTKKKVDSELAKLGWKQHALKNKEYSKSYIDISGQLKNFNAVADEVELLTVEA